VIGRLVGSLVGRVVGRDCSSCVRTYALFENSPDDSPDEINDLSRR